MAMDEKQLLQTFYSAMRQSTPPDAAGNLVAGLRAVEAASAAEGAASE